MGTFIDLSGRKFGRWTVEERDSNCNKKNIYWKCICDCGTKRSVAGTSLRSGISTSCGCDKEKTSYQTKTDVEDLVGKRFGQWQVIEQDLTTNRSSKRGARWICKCDCGTIKSVLGYSLRMGRTSSCGCKNSQTHILDLTGKRFGKLLVLHQDTASQKGKGGARWVCICDCGEITRVRSSALRSGQTKSCGCLKKYNTHNNHDLSGKEFGWWKVIKLDTSRKREQRFYFCRCKCGKEKSVSTSSLIRGLSKSCGCRKAVPKNDLSGKKFGRLTVLGIDTEKRGHGMLWKCQCDCGEIKSYSTSILLRKKVVSCGCKSREQTSKREFLDITNHRFGRLLALNINHIKADKYGNTDYYWNCLCDCGNSIIVQGTVLRRGDTKSCGCLQSEQSAHRAKSRIMDLLGKRFGKLIVVERVDKPGQDGFFTWKCICDCGNEKLADGYTLRKGLVTSCGCLRQSKYEFFVLQYFGEKGYECPTDYEYQKRFDGLLGYGERNLSYDFSFYRSNVLVALIECQGLQHYEAIEFFGGEEQLAKQQLHDELKREYAKKLNVPLIEIPYTADCYERVKEILSQSGI